MTWSPLTPPPGDFLTGCVTWGESLYLSVSASSSRGEEICALHQAGALEPPRFDLGPSWTPFLPPHALGHPILKRPLGLEPRTQTARPGWSAWERSCRGRRQGLRGAQGWGPQLQLRKHPGVAPGHVAWKLGAGRWGRAGERGCHPAPVSLTPYPLLSR